MATLQQTIKQSRLYPVLVLERLVSHRLRGFFIAVAWLLALVFAGLLFWAQSADTTVQLRPLFGALILAAILGLAIYLLEAFFRSYYFGSIITNDYQARDLFSFTVGRILYEVKGDDVLTAFIHSETGGRVLRRLGLSQSELESFLHSRTGLTQSTLSLAAGQPLLLAGL